MNSVSKQEVSHEVPPWLIVYKDGTIKRLIVDDTIPAGLDSETGVISKDVVVIPETNVSARLYRPNSTAASQKLPLLVYFHGGAFCVSSARDPVYHNFLNKIVAEANIIVVSVDYRRAPEDPLPAAYDDSWAVIQWTASHASGSGTEAWLKYNVDFGSVFLGGDSAGANISHHMATRAGESYQSIALQLVGIIMIHPYFWGKEPIGSEAADARKPIVDNWWEFLCPSDKGSDDPLINPFVDEAPKLTCLACNRVLVFIAEKDILKDRGKLYYESVVKSGWKGLAEMVETEGEDHVFHLFNPNSEKAVNMTKGLASFIKGLAEMVGKGKEDHVLHLFHPNSKKAIDKAVKE